MENQSPFLAMQRAEQQIKAVLRTADTDLLDQAAKKTLASIKRLSAEARLDIRDYELSETREEQIAKREQAKKRLAQLQANILAAGPVFGPADVAHITAALEQITGNLQ